MRRQIPGRSSSTAGCWVLIIKDKMWAPSCKTIIAQLKMLSRTAKAIEDKVQLPDYSAESSDRAI